jgi:hypothetical protein
VSDAEYEAETSEWREFQEDHLTLTCRGDIVRYQLKPAIRALFPDSDDRLWVEQLRGGTFRFEVWSGDTLIGTLPAPPRFPGLPPSILGDRLAVVTESPDGAHEVRLYRIRR